MRDVQHALKSHGVDGHICIAVKVVGDFEDPAKTLEGFRVLWMLPELRFKKGLPDLAASRALSRRRERRDVAELESDARRPRLRQSRERTSTQLTGSTLGRGRT
jgi:hypothetical protein